MRPRGITKTGNKVVRSHLLEAAWCYRLRAKVGQRLARRDASLPEAAKEIAWKAQVRLCGRYRRLLARGKKSQLVTTAIARELVGFFGQSAESSTRSRFTQPETQSAHSGSIEVIQRDQQPEHRNGRGNPPASFQKPTRHFRS